MMKLLSARFLCTLFACLNWAGLTVADIIGSFHGREPFVGAATQVLLISTIVLSYFNRSDRRGPVNPVA